MPNICNFLIIVPEKFIHINILKTLFLLLLIISFYFFMQNQLIFQLIFQLVFNSFSKIKKKLAHFQMNKNEIENFLNCI